jgi:hypothetical protein
MFRHVVMFRWNEDVTVAEVRATSAALDALPALVPSIRDYRHGGDAGVNSGNFDYVVVADFDDADGYLAYRDHPDHRALIAAHITGRVADRAAVQFEVA